MKRYSTFLGRKNQYCEIDYTTKCNLQIQVWSLSNYQWHFFTELGKKFHNSYGNTKTLNSQSNLEKEEWSWRNQHSWLQIILQSYSYQDSMVLAQKQKYRQMEQARKPRNKTMYLWVPYFWQKWQEYTMGKRQPLQQVMLGNWHSHT